MKRCLFFFQIHRNFFHPIAIGNNHQQPTFKKNNKTDDKEQATPTKPQQEIIQIPTENPVLTTIKQFTAERLHIDEPKFITNSKPHINADNLARKNQLQHNLIQENEIYPTGMGKILDFHCGKNKPCYRIDKNTGEKIYYVCIHGHYCKEATVSYVNDKNDMNDVNHK